MISHETNDGFYDAEAGIFLENSVNTLVADTQVSGVARTAIAMVLTISYQRAFVFHE